MYIEARKTVLEGQGLGYPVLDNEQSLFIA